MIRKQLGLLLLLIYSSLSFADYLDGKLAYEIGDYQTAYNEFNSVADSESENQADALFHLAWMYENGLGLSVDKERALEDYKKSATLGQNQAQFALGYAYANGLLGLEKSPIESLKWYAKSANEGGNKDACYNLGVAYLNGIDKKLNPNLELARSWFQVGSDLGSVESIYALAAIYYEGNGVPKDTPKAMRLLNQASLMGFGRASFFLAQLYERQKPLTDEDKKQAYYHYLKALDMGYTSTTINQKIDGIMMKMEAEDILAIQQQIANQKGQTQQAQGDSAEMEYDQ